MLVELGRILVRQEEECPPAQAVADAVQGRAGLAGIGGGAGERAPFRREVSDWAGEGAVGMGRLRRLGR